MGGGETLDIELGFRDRSGPCAPGPCAPGPCRLCLGEPSLEDPTYRRCPCAAYHDSCFRELLSRRDSESCDVCRERYDGVRRVDRMVVLADVQRQAGLWALVYAVLVLSAWAIRLLEMRCAELSCAEQRELERAFFALGAVSAMVVAVQALAACACPARAGLVVSRSTRTLVVVPGRHCFEMHG